MIKLKQKSLDGIATESTRVIEKKLVEVIDALEINEPDRASLRDRFNLISQHSSIGTEVLSSFNAWSKTRNDYTHATSDTFDKNDFIQNYEVIIAGLDELIPKKRRGFKKVAFIIFVFILIFLFLRNLLLGPLF